VSLEDVTEVMLVAETLAKHVGVLEQELVHLKKAR
jgi:hypothetical protein